VLVNIFVAIILNAYQRIVDENPDANDASQFMSMVIVQAKKTTIGPDPFSFSVIFNRKCRIPPFFVHSNKK